jgi:N6-adenosine-specific RNA methylase IME4
MTTANLSVSENVKSFYPPKDGTGSEGKPESVDFAGGCRLGEGAFSACRGASDCLQGGGAATKLYQVVYADPPWRYDFIARKKDRVENHYPTMLTDEICRLRFPAAKNAVLYLWATAPKLEDALQVMKAWGFKYKTQMVWDKNQKGFGYWFMSSHEVLLIGTRGHFSPPPPALRIKSVFTQKKGKHSRKPDDIRNLIASWFPDADRLELFARTTAEGWDAWGNDVPAQVDGISVAPETEQPG